LNSAIRKRKRNISLGCSCEKKKGGPRINLRKGKGGAETRFEAAFLCGGKPDEKREGERLPSPQEVPATKKEGSKKPRSGGGKKKGRPPSKATIYIAGGKEKKEESRGSDPNPQRKKERGEARIPKREKGGGESTKPSMAPPLEKKREFFSHP